MLRAIFKIPDTTLIARYAMLQILICEAGVTNNMVGFVPSSVMSVDDGFSSWLFVVETDKSSN